MILLWLPLCVKTNRVFVSRLRPLQASGNVAFTGALLGPFGSPSILPALGVHIGEQMLTEESVPEWLALVSDHL